MLPTVRFAGQRVLQAALTLTLVLTVAFMLTHVLGNPVAQMLPLEHTKEQYDELRTALGYDRPVLVQYADFIGHAIRGDLGESIIYGRPAIDVLLSRLPVTMTLAGSALTLALIFGTTIGILGGAKPGTLFDRIGVLIATIGQAVPSFVIAVFLILIFSVKLQWFPAGGWMTASAVVLPTISLTLWAMAGLIRLTRSSVRELLAQPYVLLAQSKGMSTAAILRSHILRLTLLPVVTYAGLQFGILLTGAVVTETIFSIPGAGRLVLDAVYQRDNAIVTAAVAAGAMFFVILDLIVDLLYLALDPRQRLVK